MRAYGRRTRKKCRIKFSIARFVSACRRVDNGDDVWESHKKNLNVYNVRIALSRVMYEYARAASPIHQRSDTTVSCSIGNSNTQHLANANDNWSNSNNNYTATDHMHKPRVSSKNDMSHRVYGVRFDLCYIRSSPFLYHMFYDMPLEKLYTLTCKNIFNSHDDKIGSIMTGFRW